MKQEVKSRCRQPLGQDAQSQYKPFLTSLNAKNGSKVFEFKDMIGTIISHYEMFVKGTLVGMANNEPKIRKKTPEQRRSNNVTTWE
jgi:hypothetical protein